MRHVVRSVVELMRAVPAPLSEHHRVSESSAATVDMNRSTSCKIKATNDAAPTIGVPRPAGNRVVDDGGPDEHKDEAGEHAATLGNGAGRKGDSDGTEHTLVDGEKDGGDAIAG